MQLRVLIVALILWMGIVPGRLWAHGIAEDAQVEVVKMKDGIKIVITSQDEELAEVLQEQADSYFSSKKLLHVEFVPLIYDTEPGIGLIYIITAEREKDKNNKD